MKYNFDKVHDRSKNQSVKWDALKEVFGAADILPMWVADMDFVTAEPVVNALVSRANEGIFGYTMEVDNYKQSIIDWCSKRHEWDIKRDCLIYSPGVVPTLSLCIRLFTEVSDKVIIQPPVYGPFERVVKDNGRELVFNMLKKDDSGYYTMDFEDLESKFKEGTRTMILCNPHNPIGRVWSKKELVKLAELVVKYDVLVISDEIHSDLVLKGNKHIPLASISKEVSNNIITCMAPTKTFNLAGVQTSFIVVEDKEKHNLLLQGFEHIDITRNNCFGQVASIAAYEDGEEWLEQMLDYIEGNIDVLIDYVNKNIPEIKVRKPEGTYLIWLDLTSLEMNNDKLKDFMVKKAKIALTDGAFFGLGGDGYMRFNVATPREKVIQGIKQIEEAIKNI